MVAIYLVLTREPTRWVPFTIISKLPSVSAMFQTRSFVLVWGRNPTSSSFLGCSKPQPGESILPRQFFWGGGERLHSNSRLTLPTTRRL